jgi:hypothetical protein
LPCNARHGIANMKTSAIWTGVSLLAAIVGLHGQCLAGEKGAPAAGRILAALEGTAVPAAQLGLEHARGVKTINVDTDINFDGSLSLGSLRGNSVIGNSATGTITTSNSINNNTGITTVFQNSGNNSLFQQTTSINITVHP